jgi:hypothetical protein
MPEKPARVFTRPEHGFQIQHTVTLKLVTCSRNSYAYCDSCVAYHLADYAIEAVKVLATIPKNS